MHIEARLFEFLTAFFVFCHRALRHADQRSSPSAASSGRAPPRWSSPRGLALITGTFFRFVARRLDTRPEDYEDAEIIDGAGELGFYSPAQLVALADRAVGVGGGRGGRDCGCRG